MTDTILHKLQNKIHIQSFVDMLKKENIAINRSTIINMCKNNKNILCTQEELKKKYIAEYIKE